MKIKRIIAVVMGLMALNASAADYVSENLTGNTATERCDALYPHRG